RGSGLADVRPGPEAQLHEPRLAHQRGQRRAPDAGLGLHDGGRGQRLAGRRPRGGVRRIMGRLLLCSRRRHGGGQVDVPGRLPEFRATHLGAVPRGAQRPVRPRRDGRRTITSSAAVVDGKVYFAGGKTMYCLDAADGSLVWNKVIGGNPEAPSCEIDDADPTRIFSSPAVFQGNVDIGHPPDGANGYRGGIVARAAKPGAPRRRFEVGPVLDASGNPAPGPGQNRGCGPVWSSAAVDERNRLVFFGTGDCGFDAPPPYHEAILALQAGSLELRWAFRPRTSDACDFDLGASPNIIDLGGNRWVGEGGKDGTYYVLNRLTRSPGGQLAWNANV